MVINYKISLLIFPGDDGNFSNVIELSGEKIYLGSNSYRKIQVDRKTNIKDIIEDMTELIFDIEIPENEVLKIGKDTIIPLEPGEVELNFQMPKALPFMSDDINDEDYRTDGDVDYITPFSDKWNEYVQDHRATLVPKLENFKKVNNVGEGLRI